MKKPRLTDADRLATESMLRSGHTVYAIAKAPTRPLQPQPPPTESRFPHGRLPRGLRPAVQT